MISIITVNYNGEKVTSELLLSLRIVGFKGEVIVVDNGSLIDEAAVLKERFPEIVAIRSERNLGFAAGNNLALPIAKGDILLLLNNDTTVTRGFDTEIENFFRTHPQVGAATPKVKFEYAPDHIQFAGYTPLSMITLRNHMIGYHEIDNGQYEEPHQTPYAYGAAMAVRRCIVRNVGLMPECYFLYYEELDWSLSISRAGWQIWYIPSAIIYHKESWTTVVRSPLKIYYQSRNRLIFAKRNLKGFDRFMSIFYQLFVAAPVNVLREVVHRRIDLAKSTIRGVTDGVVHNYCRRRKKEIV